MTRGPIAFVLRETLRSSRPGCRRQEHPGDPDRAGASSSAPTTGIRRALAQRRSQPEPSTNLLGAPTPWLRSQLVPAQPIDVSTYNRFLLTVGIALITLAVVAPWLLLKATGGPLLSRQARAELSAPSTRALERRERFENQAFAAVWPVSGTMMIVGAGFLVTGSRRLRRRQPVLDRVEDLDVKERELRVRDLNPQEKEDKRSSEVSETVQEEIEASVIASERRQGPPASSDRVQDVADAYAKVEHLVLEKLREAFPSDQIDAEIAIESAAEKHYADAIVRAQGHPDLLIEIKYQTVPLTVMARDRARQLASLVRAYEEVRQERAQGCLIYVIPPALARSPRRSDFEQRLITRSLSELDEAGQRKVGVIVLGRDELAEMDAASFRSLLRVTK